jgi:hypothetical protein
MGAERRSRLKSGTVFALAVAASGVLGVPAALGASASSTGIRPVSIDHGQTIRGGTAASGPEHPVEFAPPEHRAPVSPERYRAIKERAASRPADSDVRSLGAPAGEPQPGAGVTTSFAGMARGAAGVIGDPPDTIIGKSSTRVLEAVNSALRLFNNTGGVIGTRTLASFFAQPASSFLFDPKVYYDRNAANRRFYVAALEKRGDGDSNTANDFSRIYLAVSRSAEPANLAATGWCRYILNGRRNADTTIASWADADYHSVGAGADTLLITTNQFRFAPPGTFTFAIVRALNKLTLANNASSCPSLAPVYTFQPSSTVGDGGAFTLAPVQHYTSPSSFTGTTNPAYLVSDFCCPTTTSNTYKVWRVANVGPRRPRLQNTTVTAPFAYGVPPSAPGGSGAPLDTGDARMRHAAGIGNQLAASHTTACNAAGGPAESCVGIVRLSVGQSREAVTAALVQQYALGLANNFFYWPSVAMSPSLKMSFATQWSSSSVRLSTSAGLIDPASSTIPFFAVGPNGSCLLSVGLRPDGSEYRTGDYTGAAVDPTDSASFWVAGERATVLSGSTACQWTTRVAKLVP